MNNQDILSAASLFEKDFGPLTEVSQYMKESFSFPYQSRFSFQPYIKSMQEQMKGACDFTKSALRPVLAQYDEFVEQPGFDIDQSKDLPQFKAMVSLIVPSMLVHDNLNFICKPFVKEFLVSTDRFKELFDGETWELKLDPELLLYAGHKGVRDVLTYILNKCYNQNITDKHYDTLIFRHKETLIERNFHLKVNFDFIDLRINGKLPELSQADINHLLNNADDIDLLLATFPADLFEFYGFMMGSFVDVTEIEVLRQLRQYVRSVENDFDVERFHTRIERYLRSYLNKSNLMLGEAILDQRSFHGQRSVSLTGMTGQEVRSLDIRHTTEGSLYHKLVSERRTVFCGDITVFKGRFVMEDALIQNGYRSVILHPILDSNGRIQNILEVGAKEPQAFNALTVQKIAPVFEILNEGYNDLIKHLENEISNIIKEKFTSIHSSVEWKFQESATTFFNKKHQGIDSDMPPVVFDDLHPLYGQSDIVSSSEIRSMAIQKDLVQNLELLLVLMDKWLAKKQIHILESFKLRVENILEGIKSAFKSSDETDIVMLLGKEIHPLLHQLSERYHELSKKAFVSYFDQLDDNYGIIYNERKSYEESVNMLNGAISAFLEQEDSKMQTTLPHYFEKYKTDGVEYNMYLGQSLLQEGIFTKFDLKNFKIWQLTNMIAIVKLVDQLSVELPIALQTAQLIFVYNTSLSIRFRMDEKKFDVDGAYNVRYEILKKRIDKAIVTGSGERLTVAGKIAIVYLNDSDRDEYLGYIEFLKQKNLITGDVEDLQLEKLQGADGLKALRISVA